MESYRKNKIILKKHENIITQINNIENELSQKILQHKRQCDETIKKQTEAIKYFNSIITTLYGK